MNGPSNPVSLSYSPYLTLCLGEGEGTKNLVKRLSKLNTFDLSLVITTKLGFYITFLCLVDNPEFTNITQYPINDEQ